MKPSLRLQQSKQQSISQSSNQSMKSSMILQQIKQTSNENNQKTSICHYQIISQDCNQLEQDNQQFYNEQSSLPLCMKQYYLNEKEFNQQQMLHQQNKQLHQQNKQQQSKQKGSHYQTQNHHYKIQNNQKIHFSQKENTNFYSLTQNQHHHQHLQHLQHPQHPQNSQHHQFQQTLLQQRNKYLSLELQKQKIKNLHFQKILSILMQQDNLQKHKFQSISKFYQDKIQYFNQIEGENRNLKLKNEEFDKQNQHLRQLIYIANRNYQNLQHKFQETKNKLTQNELEIEKREKGFHQKLENLKSVLKSLMLNLNTQRYSTQSEDKQIKFQSKQLNNCDNCYSFGDQEINLRQRKQANSQNLKIQEANQYKKNKLTKLCLNLQNFGSGKLITNKKTQQKQNLLIIQKDESNSDSLQSQNKTTSIGKLKSPKNIAVEQNYRKLFMKTLFSSTQKQKNTFRQ